MPRRSKPSALSQPGRGPPAPASAHPPAAWSPAEPPRDRGTGRGSTASRRDEGSAPWGDLSITGGMPGIVGASQGDAGRHGDQGHHGVGGTRAMLGAAADPGLAWAGGRLAASGSSLSARLCPGSRVVAAVISLALRLLMRKTWLPRGPSQHKGARTKTRFAARYAQQGRTEIRQNGTGSKRRRRAARAGAAPRGASLPTAAHGKARAWRGTTLHKKSCLHTRAPSFWSRGKSLPCTKARRDWVPRSAFDTGD